MKKALSSSWPAATRKTTATVSAAAIVTAAAYI
jgi:hypothetical protein